MRTSGRRAGRTAQVRSCMRGRGAGWAYPNVQVKGGGGGRQGAGRTEASMPSTSAALCYGFTEAECPLKPQAPRRRPGYTGRHRPRWPSAGPARGIALCIGVHAAYARSTPVDSRPLPSHIPVVGIDRSELDIFIDCVAEQWPKPLPSHIPVVWIDRSESAISRSARAEWACAYACAGGQPGLIVAYFPSR